MEATSVKRRVSQTFWRYRREGASASESLHRDLDHHMYTVEVGGYHRRSNSAYTPPHDQEH